MTYEIRSHSKILLFLNNFRKENLCQMVYGRDHRVAKAVRIAAQDLLELLLNVARV